MKTPRYKAYRIWRRSTAVEMALPPKWLQTAHLLSARTAKEAQSRTRRIFSGASFHSMQLVAVLDGTDPNETETKAPGDEVILTVAEACAAPFSATPREESA